MSPGLLCNFSKTTWITDALPTQRRLFFLLFREEAVKRAGCLVTCLWIRVRHIVFLQLSDLALCPQLNLSWLTFLSSLYWLFVFSRSVLVQHQHRLLSVPAWHRNRLFRRSSASLKSNTLTKSPYTYTGLSPSANIYAVTEWSTFGWMYSSF